jgi:hypothetical protein
MALTVIVCTARGFYVDEWGLLWASGSKLSVQFLGIPTGSGSHQADEDQYEPDEAVDLEIEGDSRGLKISRHVVECY